MKPPLNLCCLSTIRCVLHFSCIHSVDVRQRIGFGALAGVAEDLICDTPCHWVWYHGERDNSTADCSAAGLTNGYLSV